MKGALMRLLWATLMIFVGLQTCAFAADICEAVALRDVPAKDNPESILKRGEIDGAVTQYRVNKKTGESVFCSHGGYCYPTHITENGKQVEALRLTNCRVGARDSYNDPDDVFYSIDVIREAIAPEALKVNDIDNRLQEIGVCSACAGDDAYLYVKAPASRCAAVVKEALEGNPQAVDTLNNDNEICPAQPLPAAEAKPISPSFDCRKARFSDEIAVCQDQKLAQMDVNLSALYRGLRAVATSGERRILDADEIAWSGQRRACGQDAKCIASSYKTRVRYLYRNRPTVCDGPELQQPAGCDPGAQYDIE
jgi:hypothetical protein